MPTFQLSPAQPLRLPVGRFRVNAQADRSLWRLELDATEGTMVDALSERLWLVRPGKAAVTLSLVVPDGPAPAGTHVPLTLELRDPLASEDYIVDVPAVSLGGLSRAAVLTVQRVDGESDRMEVTLLSVTAPDNLTHNVEVAAATARRALRDDETRAAGPARRLGSLRIMLDGSASMSAHARSGLLSRVMDGLDGIIHAGSSAHSVQLIVSGADSELSVEVDDEGLAAAVQRAIRDHPLSAGFRWEPASVPTVVVTDCPPAAEDVARTGDTHVVLLLDAATLRALGGAPPCRCTLWARNGSDDEIIAALTADLYGVSTEEQT